jgi:hypothetical protein
VPALAPPSDCRLIRQIIVAVMGGGVPSAGIDDIFSIAEAIAAATQEGN